MLARASFIGHSPWPERRDWSRAEPERGRERERRREGVGVGEGERLRGSAAHGDHQCVTMRCALCYQSHMTTTLAATSTATATATPTNKKKKP